MGIKELIILAGGLGTRLRSAVPDVPKCMAPINGRPFLSFVIDYYQSQKIEKFIFSVGYKKEMIVDFLAKEYPSLSYQISAEDEPLGTGGAIKKACLLTDAKCVLVTNGDTLYKIDVEKVADVHCLSGASCSLSLKPMKDFDRYGVVELDNHCVIKSFKEKQHYQHGLINGGVYALHAHKFLDENLPEKFSFETDYLEKYYKKRVMFGIVQDEYFIDIGIPEDFDRAQRELK